MTAAARPRSPFLLTPAQHREQAEALRRSGRPELQALAILGEVLASAIERRRDRQD